MFKLFFIFAPAVLGVASQNRRPRRWGMVLTGFLCLLIGLQAGTALAQASFANLLCNLAAASEEDQSNTDVGAKDGQDEASLQAEVASSDEVGELGILEKDVADDGSSIERLASVEKLDVDLYPDWLRESLENSDFTLASKTSEDDVQYMVVKSTPCVTQTECQRDLDDSLRIATNDYINDYLDSPRAAMLMRYSVDDIRERLVKDTFVERIYLIRYGQNMRIAHAHVGFDHAFRQDLDRRWDQIVATVRVAQTGLGAGVVLALLGTMFGYFRFDTATRGYYTGRLQFAAAAVILTVAVGGVLVAKWIPWM